MSRTILASELAEYAAADRRAAAWMDTQRHDLLEAAGPEAAVFCYALHRPVSMTEDTRLIVDEIERAHCASCSESWAWMQRVEDQDLLVGSWWSECIPATRSNRSVLHQVIAFQGAVTCFQLLDLDRQGNRRIVADLLGAVEDGCLVSLYGVATLCRDEGLWRYRQVQHA